MRHAYFIGIGGAGMSALARYFKSEGWEVSGYDRTCSWVTTELQKDGIPVHYCDQPDLLPQDVDDTLVVWTPAVQKDLQELRRAECQGYTVLTRAKVLGMLSMGHLCLAVAGTHGKTTTTALTAHILTSAGDGCKAFIGGTTKNYRTNYIKGPGESIVVEADEFNRSFLELFPDYALITSTDADHLDVYGESAKVLDAFKAFAKRVSTLLIVKKGVLPETTITRARVLTYHDSDRTADFHADNIRPVVSGRFLFDLVHPGGVIRNITTGVPGRVNLQNCIAAAALALSYGVPAEKVKAGICSFLGVSRRLDVHVDLPGAVYIDDFAHHPAELAAAIASIREMYPGRKLTAVFQPHLYSRTRDFADEFARVLSSVDELFLMDIYPARESPITGVSAELILDKVTCKNREIVNKGQLLDRIRERETDIIITFGAGDISLLAPEISLIVREKSKKKNMP